MTDQHTWRKTTQNLMPRQASASTVGQYGLYPAFPLGEGKMAVGYRALAERIAAHKQVILDGYVGVFWE